VGRGRSCRVGSTAASELYRLRVRRAESSPEFEGLESRDRETRVDLAGVILGLVLAIIWAEASAWLPALTRRIIRLAAKRLEPDLRERMEEEWLRYVQDMPGILGPFFAGCKCLLASVRIRPIRIAARRLQPAPKGRGLIPPSQINQFYLERLKELFHRSANEQKRLMWISAIAMGAAFSAALYVAGIKALASLLSGGNSP